ncbi:unnamed protein product (macronuclear) [Paramecium tetraurelia]|uniref:Uncharacterized protein n=1 Tax=Paramecium tetraurelia TaxID=5888 RepID=A0BTQ8_PARTE|nr:uncharacterized protein GSPATT00032157001 [Paramecium tetraurelia]CAK61925.1 unnamed protein product [Paramecium tetraurelia]|eukprot:XP_001429323.1 hypothetical protein (macronuclear) [Paramecium tetraurelia strain d4-2]
MNLHLHINKNNPNVVWPYQLTLITPFQLWATDNDIQIFQFQKAFLKKLTQIKKASEAISTLNFFEHNSNFIAGSFDSSIIIWPMNLTSTPKYITKLQEKYHFVRCLAVLSSEDLVISGSHDHSIKFWSYSTSQTVSPYCWFQSQTITEHTSTVWGLSINEDENKLISCGEDKLILIIERTNKHQWIVKQKVYVENGGFRLSFINNDSFASQPHKDQRGSSNLDLYQFDVSTDLYVRTGNVPIKGKGQYCRAYFPQLYIPSKQMILSKNGYYINLIRFTQSNQTLADWECRLVQTINFDQHWIFGTVSRDGEYIITWDDESKAIQTRQLIAI